MKFRGERSAEDRFWEKVDRNGPILDPELGPCWIWTGSRHPQGYGAFWLRGKTPRVHRVSWMLMYGDIPDGQQVNHHCDNMGCVNPAHLYLGTQKENVRDREQRGRSAPTYGMHSGSAKLTDQQIIEIRARAKQNEVRAHLAREYGIKPSQVTKIIKRTVWKHLP